MDVNVKWGKHADSKVRIYPGSNPVKVQLMWHATDAPTQVLSWPDRVSMMLTPAQAKKLGAALIRVANSD